MIRPSRNVCGVVAAVSLMFAVTCQREDPYTRALRERQSYGVELKSWSPGEDRILFEIEIRGRSGSLSLLTVLVTQYDAAGEMVREDRVPLPLEGLGGPGVTQVLGSVPGAGAEPDSLSVLLEVYPPEDRLDEYPELRPLLPAAPAGPDR